MSGFLGIALLLGLSSYAHAQYPLPSNAPVGFPAWWFQQNVIVPASPTNITPTWPADYPPSDDFTIINQGTLKNLALGAITELQQRLPSAVLTNSNAVALQNLIGGWTTNPATNADNYALVNQGQLKYLAKQFYDVLGSGSYTSALGLQPSGWTGPYPWGSGVSSNGTNADSYSLANIGQAKYIFSFDLTAPSGQIPAWWSQYYFGTTNVNASQLSTIGDGLTLLQEYQYGRNPTNASGGSLSSISIVSGSSQLGSPGALVTAPLVVSLTGVSNNPIYGNLVVFSVVSGGGSLQATSVTAPSNSITAVTDTSGQARVFFKLPNTKNAISRITCTPSIAAQPSNVTFVESTDNGSGTYTSPFAPSSVNCTLNPDGSIDMTWVSYADPSDTTQIPIEYQSTNGSWITVTTVPASTTSYHLLPQ